jgi:hypothetical protein
MTLCNAGHTWRYTVSALACFCALSFLVGCNGGKATGASQPTPAATTGAAASPSPTAQQPPSTPAQSGAVNPKPVAPEKYERLNNPRELGLDIEVQATLTRGTPNDDGVVEGKVASLTVGGKKLELVSSDIAQDAKERSWIVTKNYGRIRITSAYSGGLILWLTPSQKESLKALYHSGK